MKVWSGTHKLLVCYIYMYIQAHLCTALLPIEVLGV